MALWVNVEKKMALHSILLTKKIHCPQLVLQTHAPLLCHLLFYLVAFYWNLLTIQVEVWLFRACHGCRQAVKILMDTGFSSIWGSPSPSQSHTSGLWAIIRRQPLNFQLYQKRDFTKIRHCKGTIWEAAQVRDPHSPFHYKNSFGRVERRCKTYPKMQHAACLAPCLAPAPHIIVFRTRDDIVQRSFLDGATRWMRSAWCKSQLHCSHWITVNCSLDISY